MIRHSTLDAVAKGRTIFIKLTLLMVLISPWGTVQAADQEGELLWNTFMGTTGDDSGANIAVDSGGNVYVVGSSRATWGDPLNAFSDYRDAFVAKLDSTGNLLWNTFMGSAMDSGRAIALDSSGNIYVAGMSVATWGTPVNPHAGGTDSDVFVAKLDSSGNLLWNTFMGSTVLDDGNAIAVDGSGNVYVAGSSLATWGTPMNVFEGGPWDGFAAKLDNSGNLLWNTFMGSPGPTLGNDYGEDIAVDGSGNAYVVGPSGSTWGTPVNAFAGPGDAFVVKLNSSGARIWNTFIGSAGNDYGSAVAADAGGNVYVAGSSNATWGTPVRAYTGDRDVFATKLDTSGGQIWNTFLGSSVYDWARVIAVDVSGNVYVGGESLATWSTPEEPHTGEYDVFAAGLDSSGVLQWNTFMGSSNYEYCAGIAADSSDNVYVAGSGWENWGTPLVPHTGDGSNDVFVVRLGSDSTDIGDINSDGTIDLIDVILSLQVLVHLDPAEINVSGDVNEDGRIGLDEIVYDLEKISQDTD